MTPARFGPFLWEFYPITIIATYLTQLLRAVLFVRPGLLVSGRRFCHFAIRYGIAHERMASESCPLVSGSPTP